MRLISTILVLCSVLSFTAFAQGDPDTLFYGDDPATVFENPFGWGYIAGTNEYGDVGKYQRFDFFGEFDVTGAIIYMGAMSIVDDPDPIRIVFKRTNGINGGPSRETIATINTTADQFDISGAGTSFTLPAPIPVNGNLFVPDTLFVGVEWDSTHNDTFAVLCDTAGLGDLEDRAWEMFSDSTVQRFNEQSSFSWLLDADMWVAALHYPAGVVGIEAQGDNLSKGFELRQNYPNPFNPETSISFSIPSAGTASLTIYDIAGKEIRSLVNGHLAAGEYLERWDGRDQAGALVASGIYFYQLAFDQFKQVRRLVLMK